MVGLLDNMRVEMLVVERGLCLAGYLDSLVAGWKAVMMAAQMEDLLVGYLADLRVGLWDDRKVEM